MLIFCLNQKLINYILHIFDMPLKPLLSSILTQSPFYCFHRNNLKSEINLKTVYIFIYFICICACICIYIMYVSTHTHTHTPIGRNKHNRGKQNEGNG